MSGMGDAKPKIDVPGESPRWAWYLACVLALLFTLSYLDRQIVGILVQPLKLDLRLTDTELSLIGGTAFILFYVTCGIVMGRAADLYNRKWIVIASVTVWTLSTALCGMSKSIWQLGFLRMGVGLGEAALGPCAYSILSDAFPRERLTTAISLTAAGGAAGMGLAYFCGALILRWATSVAGLNGTIVVPLLGPLVPWRIVFLTIGLTGVVFAGLMLPVREPPRLRVCGNDGDYVNVRKVPLADVLGFFRDNRRALTCFYLAMGCISITGYTASFWDIAFFERTYGWPPIESGRIYGFIAVITAIVGAIVGGRLADYLSKRWSRNANLISLVAIAALNIPFRMLYPLAPTLTVAVVFGSIALFLLAMPWGIAAAGLQIMVPSRMRGQFSAIYVFVNALGMAVGPTATALVTDYGFGNGEMLRYSLLIVGTSAQALAALLFWRALHPYQAALNNATAENGRPMASSSHWENG